MKRMIVGIWTSVAFCAGAQTYTVTDLGITQGAPVALNEASQVAGNASNQAFRYSGGLQFLGNLGGPSGFSFASAMNASGAVVGTSEALAFVLPDDPEPFPVPHAFHWAPSTGMRDLGTLGGLDSSARAINDLGAVVGDAARADGMRHAFLWTEGDGMHDLGSLGGRSGARAINNQGTVVGTFTTTAGEERGFVWTSTEGMRDLGTLGGTFTTPSAVNGSGSITGGSQTVDIKNRPFVWTSAAGMTEIPVPGTWDPPDTCSGTRINAAGQVLLSCFKFFEIGKNRAFVWSEGSGTVDLGTLGGNVSAWAMNSSGVVVGTAALPDGRLRAFIYADGAMKDLNSLLTGTAVPELISAQAIADNGTIVALTSSFTLVLLTPQPSAPPPGDTPSGTAVEVDLVAALPDGTSALVNLTFAQVSVAGQTSISASDEGPPPPGQFKLGNPAVYYDVSTTAVFIGGVTLCFGWSEGQFQNERAIRLKHFEGGAWADITTMVDTVNNVACGQANSLSPFALMETAFEFAGFHPPLSNPPSTNAAKAGSAIPVKFSLGGDHGLDIFAAGYPSSIAIACSSLEPESSAIESVTAGTSTLAYDPGSDLYTFVWKTSKQWAGTCRQFVARFSDGTEKRANVSFK